MICKCSQEYFQVRADKTESSWTGLTWWLNDLVPSIRWLSILFIYFGRLKMSRGPVVDRTKLVSLAKGNWVRKTIQHGGVAVHLLTSEATTKTPFTMISLFYFLSFETYFTSSCGSWAQGK